MTMANSRTCALLPKHVSVSSETIYSREVTRQNDRWGLPQRIQNDIVADWPTGIRTRLAAEGTYIAVRCIIVELNGERRYR